MVVGNSKNAPTNLGMPIGTTQGLLITTVSAKLHLKTTVFACPTSTQWQNPRVFRAFSAFSAPFSVIAENAENARKTRKTRGKRADFAIPRFRVFFRAFPRFPRLPPIPRLAENPLPYMLLGFSACSRMSVSSSNLGGRARLIPLPTGFATSLKCFNRRVLFGGSPGSAFTRLSWRGVTSL